MNDVRKKKSPVGRPPKGHPIKQKVFTLPEEMFYQINDAAKKHFGGNASALAEHVFREYLDKLGKGVMK